MNSMQKFFYSQMDKNTSPSAIQKLFTKILPKLCIENDICSACSGDLEISSSDLYEGGRIGTYKVCTACKMEYKGDNPHDLSRRRDIKPETFIQGKGSTEEE